MLNLNLIHNQVSLGFTSPTARYKDTIVELSMRQWNRFRSNSIMVEDSIIHMSDNIVPLVSYDKITYGVNINMKREKITSLGKMLHCKEPNIGNIKGGFIHIPTLN